MEKPNKNKVKNEKRKRIFGIKLPPIERIENDDVKTVFDYDPQYYTLVEGRPIRPNTSILKYKQDIKGVALKRTLIGFLSDEILRIDKEIERERKIYEMTSSNFDQYKNSFEKFLADDNNKTIKTMQKSDALAKDVSNKTEELKKASYEIATIKSKLQYMDETLLILLSFQNFLHKASPILWQTGNNIKLDVKHEEICQIDADIFQEVNVDIVKKKLSELPPPKLYFENPKQLMEIFDNLGTQNTNYLLVTEEVHSEKNKYVNAYKNLKYALDQELDFIRQKIKETEEMMKECEEREMDRKEIFFKILNDKIKYLVCSQEALQIYNYVEYAYEKLIAPNDIDLSSVDMIAAIKSEYDNLMFDLTIFDPELVKSVEKEVFNSCTKEIKRAKEASKLLKEVEKLNRRLKSAFEPCKREIRF